MTAVFGFDTSNYTTSTAAVLSSPDRIVQRKQLLPVKPGERGLRQSDTVFHHTAALPALISSLCGEVQAQPDAVCVSVTPRMEEGSYMPCFLVGKAAASVMAASHGVPLFTTSHQHGHVAAALFGAGKLDLLETRFLAFHVSGGTTEALLVEPDETEIFRCTCVSSSLDLKAGQVIDRVGVALGLDFPAGAALDALSQTSEKSFRVKPSMRDGRPSFSGIENQCRRRIDAGEAPADVAKFCFESVAAALEGMIRALKATYGDLPLLFAGGVTSNRLISERFSEKYGAVFAPAAYSCDNAAGVALIGRMKLSRG